MTLDCGVALCYMCFVIVRQIWMCGMTACVTLWCDATKMSRCIFKVPKYRVASSLPVAVVMYYLITNDVDMQKDNTTKLLNKNEYAAAVVQVGRSGIIG